MLELNLNRTGLSWLFGHNHHKSSASSTPEKQQMKRRGHFHLWGTLFKRCHSHSVGLSFPPCARSFHGEVLITFKQPYSCSLLCSERHVCVHASNYGSRPEELEGAESRGRVKWSLKKVKWCLKGCFLCLQRSVLAPRGLKLFQHRDSDDCLSVFISYKHR